MTTMLEKCRRCGKPILSSVTTCWNAVESRRKALPCDLGAAARTLQASHAGMNRRAHGTLSRPRRCSHLRKGETIGQALVRARKAKADPKPWDGETFDFNEWLDAAVQRAKERKERVEAIEELEWEPGKRLLVRGSEAVFVD